MNWGEWTLLAIAMAVMVTLYVSAKRWPKLAIGLTLLLLLGPPAWFVLKDYHRSAPAVVVFIIGYTLLCILPVWIAWDARRREWVASRAAAGTPPVAKKTGTPRS